LVFAENGTFESIENNKNNTGAKSDLDFREVDHCYYIQEVVCASVAAKKIGRYNVEVANTVHVL